MSEITTPRETPDHTTWKQSDVVPTLDMVAALAGVSRSTASRVLNGSPQITQATVDAVTAAVDQLNYVPNRVARNLARRSTQMIAVVIPEHTAAFFADPYFASIIQSAARYLSSTDYTLTLLVASEADPDKTRRFLRGGNADGALILSHHIGDRDYLNLARSIPVVFAGRPLEPMDGDPYIVDIDNVAASKVATRHLVQRGCRRIATITGPLEMSAGVDRVDGWRAALEEAGQETDLIEVSDFSYEGGAAAAERLLERSREFDGLFAASAKMAAGAISTFKREGLRVPDDIAVTTIDNDFFARNSDLPLTTVDQHTGMKGAVIAETLIRLINGETVERITYVPTELIIGTSA